MSTDQTLVQLDFDEPHHDLLIDRNTSTSSSSNGGGTNNGTQRHQQQQPTHSSYNAYRYTHHQPHDDDGDDNDVDDHHFGHPPSSQQQQQRPGGAHQFAAAIPPPAAVAAVHTRSTGADRRPTTSALANDHQLLEHLSGDADDRHSIISLTSSSAAEDVCLVPEVGFADINLADHGDHSRESQPLLGGGGRGDHADQGMFNYFPGNDTEEAVGMCVSLCESSTKSGSVNKHIQLACVCLASICSM